MELGNEERKKGSKSLRGGGGSKTEANSTEENSLNGGQPPGEKSAFVEVTAPVDASASKGAAIETGERSASKDQRSLGKKDSKPLERVVPPRQAKGSIPLFGTERPTIVHPPLLRDRGDHGESSGCTGCTGIRMHRMHRPHRVGRTQ